MAEVIVDGQRYVPAENVALADMPKLMSPFVRGGEGHFVTPEIEEGHGWVFEEDDVLAVEKIAGTNVSVCLQGGYIVGLMNRTQVKPYGTLDGHPYIVGVRTTAEKKRMPFADGQHFGELMGPKVQSNFLNLQTPEWFPFEYLQKKFHYKSWGRYPKDFETISRWFKEDLFSLMHAKFNHGEHVRPEGVVFVRPNGDMAKLRCDMFDWYKGQQHQRDN